jgi:hypothetical protein
MLNQPKPILKSAVKVFILVFAIALALLLLVFAYLIIKVGWTEAVAYAVKDVKKWLGALILTPTVCVAGDLLGNLIDRVWRSRK